MHSSYQPTPKSTSEDEFHIIASIGTAFQELVASFAANNPNALILGVDVPHELDKLVVPSEAESRIIRVPLGNNQTLQELVDEYGTESQKSAMGSFGAISSNDGMGQLPCCGPAAIKKTLSQSHTRRTLNDIVPEVIRRANGTVPQIRLGIYAGSAGGVACRGGSEFLTALIETIINSGVDSIDASVFLLGGITFAGRGFTRTQSNSGCSLVTWIEQSRKPSTASVTYSLYGLELTPVGGNRELRSQLLANHLSGLSADAVKDRIRQERSNRSADGPIGFATVVGAGQYRGIANEQTRNDIASCYLEELRPLTDLEPAHERVKAIQFEYDESRHSFQPPRDLIEQLIQLSDAEAVFELCDPGPAFEDIELVAELLDETRPPLSRLQELFANLPATPKEFKERVSLLLALQERCSNELLGAEEEERELELALEQAKEKLFKAFRSFVRRPLTSWQSEDQRFEALCFQIEHYRDCLNAWREVTEEVVLLSQAIDDCEELIIQHLSRLDNLIFQLKKEVRHSREISRTSMVNAQPLDGTFFGLLTASLEPNQVYLSNYLSLCVESVTRNGLRHISGAIDESADAIVTAIRSEKTFQRGPEWGGQAAQPNSTRFIVYPCVSKADQKLLSSIHLQADPNIEIAFAKRDAPARNVINVRLSYCRELADLIAPYYQAGIRKSISDPDTSSLYLPDLNVLGDIGIEIKS